MKLNELLLSGGLLLANPDYSFLNCNFEFSDKLLSEEIIIHYNKTEAPKQFEEYLEKLDEISGEDNYISRDDFRSTLRKRTPLEQFPYLYNSFMLLRLIE